MIIREARAEDTDAMSKVLIASITELCIADHCGDRAIIAKWTANKTPKTIARWLANPANHNFVADEAGEVLGVGAFHDKGEIQLNYVSPAARFAGVSKAMLGHLERAMRDSGIREGMLTSTETAHRFYLSAGWRDHGEPEPMFRMSGGYHMKKALV
jgi:GNAT superfamily N-acetyltransferase